MFIQIERPAGINPSLRDTNAWDLLQLVLGVEIDHGEDSSDWYDVLVANLAGESAAAMRELFSERAALVAPTWSRLSDGVLLIQVPDRATLQHLVGPGRVTRERQQDGLTIYETTRGLVVGTDGRTLVISQRNASSELFSHCIELLNGSRADALQAAPEFAGKVRLMPRRRTPPQGFLYFSSNAEPATTNPTTAPASAGEAFWPELSAGVVGMYVVGNRADILLRASLARPSDRTRSRIDLQRLKRLPRSTLAAWATDLDVDEVFDRFLNASPDTGVGACAEFITRLLNPARLKREVVSKVGPRLILVWGHDLEAENGASSLAVMLESTNAAAVKRALDRSVRQVVRAVNPEPVGEEERGTLRVDSEQILGIETTVIELADYVSTTEAGHAVRRLTSTLRPCYAVLDDWVVIAWNRDHMRELVAAYSGSQPALGQFNDVARLTPLRRGPTAVGVGQLATAGAVLAQWLNAADKDPDSILHLLDRGPTSQEAGSPRLTGLTLGMQSRVGRVPVAEVDADGPCYGLVQADDDVVALDGQVLDLEDSAGDLQQRLGALPDGQRVTLRLDRAGALTDVEVTVERPGNPRRELTAGVLRALRRLQTLSRHLALATIAVTQTDAHSLHAHFRLRFSAPP